MAKSQEELNAIKEDVETLNNKLNELTEEELEQVSGGADKKDYYTSLNLPSKIDRASKMG